MKSQGSVESGLVGSEFFFSCVDPKMAGISSPLGTHGTLFLRGQSLGLRNPWKRWLPICPSVPQGTMLSEAQRLGLELSRGGSHPVIQS